MTSFSAAIVQFSARRRLSAVPSAEDTPLSAPR